ncbi:MAG: DUF2142 domain-containing protein [Clostridia bacterium]|nr:DUF2142 domain-containing protein [Clostridia bacterium]
MRERTQKLIVLLALLAVAVFAVMAAANVQVSPETLELWDNEEMPAFTDVAGMQLHLPVGTFVLTLGVAGILLAWILTRKEPKLHWATLVLILCAGVMIAVGKRPDQRLAWDTDTHRMWVYIFSTWEHYTLVDYLSSFNTWFFGYLPYSVGMLLGKLLGLTESWALRLSFITGVAAYAGVCTAAVKIAPRYKLTFMIAAVLPTCLYQASNISYDAMVMAGVLLGLAILVREMDCPEKRLSGASALGMTVSIVLGTIAKPVYSVALLLLWMLPVSKFGSKKRAWIFRIFVLVLLLACLYSCLLGMYAEQIGGDDRMGEGVDSAAQVQFILANPLFFLREMGDFLVTTVPRYLTNSASQWAHWGAGKTSGVLMAALWLLCPLCCLSEKKTSPLTWGRRVWLFVLSLIPIVALMVVQYIVSTPVGSDSIAGMQGRYVLPVLPLLSLVIMLPQKLRDRVQPAARWVALAAALIALGCIYADSWQIIMVKMQGVMLG